jgi:hypothetical protein
MQLENACEEATSTEGPRKRELPKHLVAKIQRDPQTGCWLWTGARDSRGYGNVRVGRSVRKAHRVVYELLEGAVAPGLDCDHLCRQPACVRPSHIEPVPHVVNVRRGKARTVPGARQRAKTQCPRGHAYSLENTYVQPSTGGRCCRACDQEKKRRKSKPGTGRDLARAAWWMRPHVSDFSHLRRISTSVAPELSDKALNFEADLENRRASFARQGQQLAVATGVGQAGTTVLGSWYRYNQQNSGLKASV